MTRAAALLGCSLSLTLALASPAFAEGQVKAGAASLDGTYNVGSSAGQYASARNEGLSEYDPHMQQVKNVPSYGVQSRESIQALVVKGADGEYAAVITNDHYIPQDALIRRTAQLASAATGGALDHTNITLSVTHNHSSPSYSSLNPGVWTFQDAIDLRFFDYYAKQNAAALKQAFDNLHDVRVSATTSYFDKTQRNPLGTARADDGTPAGFTSSFTDHDLSVIRFENVDEPAAPKPLSTLVNLGQHPEFLNGVDLISAEFPGAVRRFVDRGVGGVTLFTQNATGNAEIEQETYHGIEEREAFNHTQYNQMEWGARQIADAVIANVRDIEAQKPNPDDTEYFGLPSYRDRFVPWMTSFPVAVEDRWFPGPVSHPYPGVNNCRTDPTLAGNPNVGTAADCNRDAAVADNLAPVTGQLPFSAPAVTADDFQELGVPFPDNVSTPSQGALQDTNGVRLQAIRLGDILLTICSCEQWTDQALNIKSRTDQIPGNEWLGYDATNPPSTVEDPLAATNSCKQVGDGTYEADGTGTGTWTCATSGATQLSDHLVQRYRSRTLNDATGWDDPTCEEMGCGVQAESEPNDLTKIRGNYTHDDTTVRGGTAQTPEYADNRGYKMVVTMSMANDYNGYIATYRDYMGRDHYRKALTGWGPHSSDYIATRLVRLGHALKGDAASRLSVDQETDPAVAAQTAPEFVPGATEEAADQAAQDVKIRAIGEASSAAVAAYAATLPDDGAGTPADVVQPKDIERFDAATFTFVGGNNYTDNPTVVVERKVGDDWVLFADQSGEVQTTLKYPGGDPTTVAAYRAGGQVWKWTATFEAFVSRFDLVDPQGRSYRATPTGTYRFRATGERRANRADEAYETTSEEFTVAPWDGITVEDAQRVVKRLTFSAGPRSTVKERRIRGTTTRDFGELPFTIGPVDFPDAAADQAATGVRFFNRVRGYSATSPENAEHYCLDCRFRDWADVAGELTATVTLENGKKRKATSQDGTFRLEGINSPATIVIRDAYGNTSAPTPVG
ncbi:MAG: hypothetical protein WKF96_01965 [Solirubrobacteraceae bacterium]